MAVQPRNAGAGAVANSRRCRKRSKGRMSRAEIAIFRLPKPRRPEAVVGKLEQVPRYAPGLFGRYLIGRAKMGGACSGLKSVRYSDASQRFDRGAAGS